MEKVCGVNPRAVRVQIAELGLRNNQVAERIGMTEQTFSRKLNGKTPWTIVELCMLADNLCCTTDFLLGRFK